MTRFWTNREDQRAGFHYSGKHKRSVRGLCLVSLVWTDGKYVFPVDFRVYNKDDGITKNEHLRDMLKTAKNRGFKPEKVMFDSWYSACEALHLLQSWSWKYMVGIKSNRVLILFPSPYQQETIPLKSFLIDQDGLRCRLKGLGIHRCFSQSSNKLGSGSQTTPTWNHNNGKHSNAFLFPSNTITEVWNNTFWLRSVKRGKYTSRPHTSAFVCVLSQRYKEFDKENESVWLNSWRIHRKRIEQSRIPSLTCEFLWNSKRCGWGPHEEGFFPTCPRGRAPGRSGRVLVNENLATDRRITQKTLNSVIVSRIEYE